MPLSGDQRALLQLICERGQSYSDIAALLEVGDEEVRARARAALTELGGADPDAEVGLTDYLLGQADPIGRADAVRHLQADAEARELAERIQGALAEIAPAAEQPALPEARGKRRRAALPNAGELRRAKREREEPVAREAAGGEPSGARSHAAPAPGAPAGGQDRRQARFIAGLVAGGVILLFAILAVAGVFSGGGSEGTTTTGADAAGDESMITTVKLAPEGGSGVAGTAKFGLVGDEQLYVDLDIQGLDPKPPADNAYLLWLMVGDQAGYPISRPLQPNDNGAYSGRLSVPSAVALTVGGQADSVVVSASPVKDLRKQIRQATEQQAPILPFTGERLAQGKIPLAQGARRKGRNGGNAGGTGDAQGNAGSGADPGGPDG